MAEAVGSLDRGHKDMGILLQEAVMNGGQGKIAGASVVAVAHENHIVAGLPVLREAAEDGVDDPVEVFGGVDEGIGEVDVLKFPRILREVLHDHALQHHVFLAGGNVQGLYSQAGDAFLSAVVQGFVDGEDFFAFLRELFADDV